jgi:signal transduction histidine kinase
MKTNIIVFFTLTILIPTALLAYFGLLAIRNEKVIVEKNMQQKYKAMADIVEEEIKNNLSQASEELLADQSYWESMLLKGASVFNEEVFLFDQQGNPLGQQAQHPPEQAAYMRHAKNLPYIIAVYELHPHLIAALKDKEKNLTFYISIIIFSVFSILGGSIFTLSALSNEWRQAKLKSEFASHLSHDLRRPLTSIRMFSEMLKSGDVPNEEKKKEYYGIISEESDKLTHLANNILDFSRIEAGRRKYNMQLEDIIRIVLETVERFKVYTINETRTVRFNRDADFERGGRQEDGIKNNYPMVKVDAGAISQALMNLLTNADKYSPPEKEVVVNLRKRKKQVVIEVVDQGEGIPKEEQKKVFQKFYRVSRRDVSEVEGSGLGLALVKYTAEAHGGKVTLESKVGQGSTFAIVLPI